MGSEAVEKVGRGDKKRKEIMIVVFGIFLLFFFVSEEKLTEIELPGAMHQMTNRDQNTGNGGTNIGTLSMKLPTQAKCNVVLKSKEAGASDKEWTTKPIWLNMYPDTINEKVHKRLINSLTGTKAGGKSYYASSKGTLRHCIGNTQTVTCSNIHPRVPFREGQLDEKLEKGVFYDKYIMMVRNPMFGLFVGYNAKAQKYSGLVGQGPEEDWKKLRDEYFESMVDDWKDLFVSWRKTKYNVGMYLVYEDLFRYSTGPDTLQTLGTFLRNAGFGVIIGDGGGDGDGNRNGNGNGGDDEILCLWHNIDPKDRMQERYSSNSNSNDSGSTNTDANANTSASDKAVHYEVASNELILKYEDEFPDYIPSYTASQKEHFLKVMNDMVEEFNDDAALVTILKRYIEDIQANIRIE